MKSIKRKLDDQLDITELSMYNGARRKLGFQKKCKLWIVNHFMLRRDLKQEFK